MSNIQKGNEALARIRASKEAAWVSSPSPESCLLVEERNVSNLLAAALVGEYPAETALKRYCSTLANRFDVQVVMAKFRSKPVNNILTCVYCGHQYPEGTTPHGSQILTDHIRICEKHPMRKLELENAHLKEIIANRSTEEELLGDIFGHDKWFGKFKLWWCDLCDTFSIGCDNKECHGSSCNAGGCPECIPVHQDFHKAKTHIWEYLTDDERKIYDKIFWLKRYMKESLAAGEYEINWKRFKEQGKLSQMTQEIFASEIAASTAAQPDAKFGDY